MMRRLVISGGIALAAFACTGDRPVAPDTADTPEHVDVGAQANAGAVILTGAGDIADCGRPHDEETAALLDSIPGTVFTAGDNAYPDGSPADFANCYDPGWGRHKARTHPALGNHEYNTAGASGYFGYFGAAAGPVGKGYYSYDLGAWHVVVLNSNIDISATSAQLQWLHADLAASNARCTMAYWHHPRFSSGTAHGSSTEYEAVWNVLYGEGAEIVVVGHEHQYERFAPQSGSGKADPGFGIREFVVGTGGGSGNAFGPPAPNSQKRDNTSPGVLKLTLDSTKYSWEFIPAAGYAFHDNGSGNCHGAAPNIAPVAVPGGPYSTTDGTVHFNGSSSFDPDHDVLTYQWDFGDGNRNVDGPHPTHTYLAGGLYQVTLTVVDGRGASSAPAAAPVSVTTNPGQVVLTGAANIARCANTNAEATATLLDGTSGFVFTAGDHAFPGGTADDMASCYHPTWGRHLTRTWAALGNNDYASGTADPTFDYFGTRAGPRGLGYYSTDLGPWHVIVLNDNAPYADFSAGSTQEQWLRQDLASHTQQCTIAIWHTPLFLSSNTAGYTANPSRAVLWNDLFAGGADVVINGNQHDYERMAPMRPDGTRDDNNGLRQFNVGTGGESSNILPTVAIHPNSVARGASFGVLQLTLRQADYDWKFLPVAGQSYTDSGSGSCHGPPPPPSAVIGGPYSSTDGTIHAMGSATDGVPPLSYRWDFGDGNTNDDGAHPSHSYDAAGTYSLSLTVTDARGLSGPAATTTATVTNSTGAVVFSGAGNISKCTNDNDEATATLLDGLPGYVFTTGDNVFNSGAASEYLACYRPTWGRHLTRSWAALGNTDYTLGNADGSFGYFGARAGPAGQGYYSTDLGGWHVIVLNENVPYSAGTPQEQWLRSDLAAHPAACTIALWHTPLFLSSNTSGYTVNPTRKILWDDLYAAGVDVVLNGNQHHYERMAPMTPTGARNDTTGIRQFNIGTGGESVLLPTVAIHPNSEVRGAVFGVLSLTLRPGGYDWQFLPVAGQSFTDQGSGTCH